VQRIVDGVHAGNIYVNRNQIGAVVGSQPFGGEGLSGTGPKAGGPHYLQALPALGGAAGAARRRARRSRRGRSPSTCRTRRAATGQARPDRIAILRKHLRGKAAEAIGAVAGARFRAGRPAGADGRGQYADALSARPGLCLGPDAETLIWQVVQALGAGNAVLAVAPARRRR
jgi:RHH-type transcriptional regulator, proline utilization regulon repressor / proline dehydrogenase / delta 1-pyrroline-5-carboxylate dehydrogenase